jgi:hypothetical protein
MHELSDLIRRRIVHGMPAAEYHAVDAIGSTTVRDLITLTPRKAKNKLKRRKQDASQALGTALHAAILEPHNFLNQIAIAPDVDRRYKEGKERWASFQETAAGRTVLTPDQGEQLRRMKEAFDACKTATALLQKCQQREVSIFADDIVPTKARLDAYCDGIVVDIKTTSFPADKDSFERAVEHWGYGVQAAAYRRVCKLAHLDFKHFMFVAIETNTDYEDEPGVAVYRLEDEVIDLYDHQVDRSLKIWKECIDSNHWPSHPDKVVAIGIPAWKRRQLQEGQVAA